MSDRARGDAGSGPGARARGPASGRRSRHAAALLVGLASLGPGAADASAQLTEPCRVGCALVLGASSLAFATGTMTAVGRLKGGFSTKGQAITSWSAGLVVVAGAGFALHGDGERQRRAVYASGLGAIGGGLAGLLVESIFGESDTDSRFAATLIGAAAGVVAGGVIGALSHGDTGGDGPTLTLVGPTLSLPLGH